MFGDGTHYQLVHRSQDLIRLLFNEKEITNDEIDLIWNATQKQGQQIKLEVYKLVIEVLRAAYSTMTDETKEHLIDKISATEPENVIESDIDIVTELGKRGGVTFNKVDGHIRKAVEFLWQIASLKQPYSVELAKIARKKFCDQIILWDDTMKDSFVADCIDNISNNRNPL